MMDDMRAGAREVGIVPWKPPSPARPVAAAAAIVDHCPPHHSTGSVHWQSDSQAEQTLKRYAVFDKMYLFLVYFQ
jgi:hypothetical protein